MTSDSSIYWIFLETETDMNRQDLYLPADTPHGSVNPKKLHTLLKRKHARQWERLKVQQIGELTDYQRTFSVNNKDDLFIRPPTTACEYIHGADFLTDHSQDISHVLNNLSTIMSENRLNLSNNLPKKQDDSLKHRSDYLSILEKKYSKGFNAMEELHHIQVVQLRKIQREELETLPRELWDPVRERTSSRISSTSPVDRGKRKRLEDPSDLRKQRIHDPLRRRDDSRREDGPRREEGSRREDGSRRRDDSLKREDTKKRSDSSPARNDQNRRNDSKSRTPSSLRNERIHDMRSPSTHVGIPTNVHPPTIGVGIPNNVRPPSINVGIPTNVRPPSIGVGIPTNVRPPTIGVGIPTNVRPPTIGMSHPRPSTPFKPPNKQGNKGEGLFLNKSIQKVNTLMDHGSLLVQNKPNRVIIRGKNGTSTTYGNPKDYDDAINSSHTRPDNPVHKRRVRGVDYLFYKTESGHVVTIGPVSEIQPLIHKFFLSM